MSRYSKYDLDPVYENDSAVIRGIIEQMVEDAIATKVAPAPKKGKPAPKKAVAPKLLLSQEHATKRGTVICSHLIVVPKGQVPSDDLDMRHVFNQHPFDEDYVRDGWNIIHDKGITQQYPDHDVYWLCAANWLSERVAKAVFDAVYGSDAPAKEEKVPVRKINKEYEVVLG